MRRAYVDFETYYSDEYSLSKMTPAQYIMDPRFEVLGAACAYDDQPVVWLEDEALSAWLGTIHDQRTQVFSHNALFDAVIMSWHYEVNPTLWGDTMGLARGLLNGILRRFSLASVCEHLEIGTKMGTVLKLKGYNKKMLRANLSLHYECGVYACDDMNKCREIERWARLKFPVREYFIIDMLIRAVTEPMFVLDNNLVHQHLTDVRARKDELLQAVALDGPAQLMSNEKFAGLLEAEGVEPPTKISKTTGNFIYAFAKSDIAMEELAQHENPRVQALVAARLGHKSTQEETRAQTFLNVASACNTMMVMPMRFSGAHTHRLSGDWKMNVQNIGRGSNLRKALKAPPGHKVVSVDSSQIEARLGAWLAGWKWLLDQFADPTQDPYANYASKLFGYPVHKDTHKMERFVGKQSILSLQYGAKAKSFQTMCRVMGGLIITEADATAYTSGYVVTAKPIVALWKELSKLITFMHKGEFKACKCVYTSKDKIHLPSGLTLQYNYLRRIVKDFNNWPIWVYGDGNTSLYGAKLMENICQALARIIVLEAGTNVYLKHKLRYKLQVHDELVYVVPAEDADRVMQVVQEEMNMVPNWASGLVLASSGAIGDNYGECK